MRDAMRLRNLLLRDAQQVNVDVQDGPVQGIVVSFDPKTQSAKVKLMPHGQETGYIPVRAQSAGNGWGMFSPPTVGSTVDVHFTDGSADAPYIAGRVHGDKDKALPTPAGETWIVNKFGHCIKLLNNGKIIIGGFAAVNDILIGNPDDLHKLVKDTFMQLFNNHTHSGSGSGPPNQRMDETDHLTIETKAS